MRKFKTIILLTVIISLCTSIPLLAASKEQLTKKNHTSNKVKTKTTFYSFPDDSYRVDASVSVSIGKPSYSRSSASVSPGTIIGDTWYDFQQNGTMGRMIDWGNDPETGNAYIHSTWMKLRDAAISVPLYILPAD